jgi:hypothetical protein
MIASVGLLVGQRPDQLVAPFVGVFVRAFAEVWSFIAANLRGLPPPDHGPRPHCSVTSICILSCLRVFAGYSGAACRLERPARHLALRALHAIIARLKFAAVTGRRVAHRIGVGPASMVAGARLANLPLSVFDQP